MEPWHPPPWALPLIVAALVVPSFLGFALAGAPAGVAMGSLSIAVLIFLAVRAGPRGPIPLARSGAAAPLLAIALAPIDGGAVANELATLAEAGNVERPAEAEPEADAGPSLLVLAPIRSTRTQVWLSDEEPGRVAAQERLAVSIATLTAAGVHAEGRVVAQDPAQALEDAAAEYGARRVAFVVDDERHDELIEEMTERLDVPVHRVSTRQV